jgi:hypothetical protein
VQISSSEPGGVRACAGEKGGAGGGRKEREKRQGEGFFGEDELDCWLILIKLEDFFAKMFEDTWQRAEASGAENADGRAGPTCL